MLKQSLYNIVVLPNEIEFLYEPLDIFLHNQFREHKKLGKRLSTSNFSLNMPGINIYIPTSFSFSIKNPLPYF